MITNFTDLEYEKALETLSEDLQDKILFLSKDDGFLKIINHEKVKTLKNIDDISYATRMTALGFASKKEMFDLIYEALHHDESETRRIFTELDTSILVPNNLNGAPEQEIVDDENEGDLETAETSTESKELDKYSETTNETAEDILKELENPTPSPSIISKTTEPPLNTTQKTQTKDVLNSIDTIKNTMENINQPQTESTQTPEQQQTKESQIDSKLKETVVQPVKSTYYKLDPYREPPE